ncbi:MAG: cupin domain-containing protein [Rhodospirillales bacterium]|nr:cupin domain-containing protein [Rhodospirillales bacterium]
MTVKDNSAIEFHNLPGLAHQTLAGPKDGLDGMEVWMQTISAGSATPVHRHDCEEVIVVLKGSGTCMIDGETTGFGPNSTLVLPSNAVHQICNTGDDDMFIVATLGMAPVRVETADGDRIDLPWD